jgi:hypothetical protein
MTILPLFGLFLSQALGQQPSDTPFCAVELLVTLPDGSRVASASADLVDGRGTPVQTTKIVNGSGSFCDFGFGLYSIRVTDRQDLSVTLQGVRFDYRQAQRLVVVMNRSAGAGSGGVAGNACRAFLRVRTPEGGALPGVKASYEGASSVADEFGRLLVSVPLKVFAPFHLEKAGYRPQDVLLSCADAGESIEREVFLRRDTTAPQQ